MRGAWLVAIALTSLSCTGVVSPREAEQLRDAERRWEAANIRNYSYEMRTSCFCPPAIIDWAVVEVRNGEVVSARSRDDGTPLSGIALTSRKTVEGMFQQARVLPEWIGDVDFEFHDELGYPLVVRLTAKSGIADADATYEARNLVPVTNGSGF